MFYGYDLAFLRTALKPQRTYNWEIMLPDMGIIPGIVVSMACQDVKFGDYNIADVDRLRYGAYESKFPGLMEIQDVQFTFIKPIPDIVSAYFYAWRNLIVDQAGYYGKKSDYARKINIYLYDTTGMISNNIQLVGVFPRTLPTYDLSYSTEEIVRLVITCNVDRMSFGEYVPPTFPADIDVPITRETLPAQIGNDEIIQRQSTNAKVFGDQLVYAFSPATAGSPLGTVAGAVLGALATTAVQYAVGVVQDTFKPRPLPKPEESKKSITVAATEEERKSGGKITVIAPREVPLPAPSSSNASQIAVGGDDRDLGFATYDAIERLGVGPTYRDITVPETTKSMGNSITKQQVADLVSGKTPLPVVRYETIHSDKIGIGFDFYKSQVISGGVTPAI